MFPQRNRGYKYPMPYSHNFNQMNYPNMMGYPQPHSQHGGSLFSRPGLGGYPPHPSQLPNQYYQYQQSNYPQQMPQQQQYQYQQQPPPSQSIFHDENGKLDFKKISGGVQSAVGLVNQVSPMMKTLSGLFIK